MGEESMGLSDKQEIWLFTFLALVVGGVVAGFELDNLITDRELFAADFDAVGQIELCYKSHCMTILGEVK